MNKHETLIREMAEEMAAKSHPISFQLYNKYKDQVDNGWSHDFYVKNWPNIVESYMAQARIAVKHMAEMFKCGYMATLPDDADETIEDRWRKDCRYIMIGRGLIPIGETGKEAGK